MSFHENGLRRKGELRRTFCPLLGKQLQSNGRRSLQGSLFWHLEADRRNRVGALWLPLGKRLTEDSGEGSG
jgi:hypothetical protein